MRKKKSKNKNLKNRVKTQSQRKREDYEISKKLSESLKNATQEELTDFVNLLSMALSYNPKQSKV